MSETIYLRSPETLLKALYASKATLTSFQNRSMIIGLIFGTDLLMPYRAEPNSVNRIRGMFACILYGNYCCNMEMS